MPRTKLALSEIERMIGLRELGVGLETIAYALNCSTHTVTKHAGHVEPVWRLERRLNGPWRKRATLALPDHAGLRKRLRNLARRGFDVPPSKEADYVTLARAQIPLKERMALLGLE